MALTVTKTFEYHGFSRPASLITMHPFLSISEQPEDVEDWACVNRPSYPGGGMQAFPLFRCRHQLS
jgi:hypothetical protein